MGFNPVYSFFNSISLAVRGRVTFPKNHIGEIVSTEQGEEFTIFRQVIISPGKSRPVPQSAAIFRVRFTITGMSPRQNKRFSLLPIPFIIGLPGFQSKFWLLNNSTGEFMGIYQWQSREYAEKYSHSFAMRFMTMRATPGSVSFSITGKSTN
jgi:hypothetical protein